MEAMLKKLPAHARILVADARKAIILHNDGDEIYPDLRVHEVLHAEPNPPTHEQGASPPGRTGFGGRKSAVAQTDWHQAEEDRFAGQALDLLLKSHAHEALVLVAPPTFLAVLRKRMPDQAKRSVLAEFDKDLTHLPVGEMEKHLTGA